MITKQIVQELKNGYAVQSGVFGAVNNKIVTKLNKYGLYEADIDFNTLSEKEIQDLESVSAMSNSELDETSLGKKLFAKTIDIKHDPILGFYTNLYAGYVVEGNFRKNASSGGLGTWILTQLLKKKLIDGVIHVHPVKNDKDGILFEYTISKTADSISKGAKSRYYPVDLSAVLRTVKKEKGKYAITGIPSFITELRLLAEHDPEFKSSIVYTVGLICGHQKSTKYAEALAWQHGIKPGDLISIDFRKKVEGQPSSRYISEFTGLVNGEMVTFTKDQNDLFISNWGHGFFKAKLSDFSDDTFNETADIALGDAWLPEYIGDSKGTNIVIIRNPEIATIFEEGVCSGALQLDILPAERIIKSQLGLVHHTRDELPYRLYKVDRKKEWRPTKRVKPSGELPLLRKKVQDTRESIATQSHIIFNEAVARDDWMYFQNNMNKYVRKYNYLYKIINIQRLGVNGVAKKIYIKIKQRFLA